MKIADRGVIPKSDALSGKRIGFGICGGIAAVETVKAIRELRRHGARVSAFCTPSVENFITHLPLEWASGERVIDSLEADVDHLEDFDLVLVAPITLNTLAKCALGLCDNSVTLLVAGQLGRRAPLLFVPTMNLQLSQHPLYGSYRNTLEGWGATFLISEEEDRLKMPDPVSIAEAVIRAVKSSK